ncbi:MAG: hypothetical protein PVF50_03370 [Gammaproteobacteria bacterium]|jgi:hypothetical protein
MSKFRADCSKCCGLCCVVPDQLAVQGFGADKPAETPCRHLTERNDCTIHAKRQSLGYPACEAFDCFGAGQWVTQNVFGGADWKDSPELPNQMFAAYRHWLPRFRAAALIEAALPHVRDDARNALVARMTELTSNNPAKDLAMIDERRLRGEILKAIRAALRPAAAHETRA